MTAAHDEPARPGRRGLWLAAIPLVAAAAVAVVLVAQALSRPPVGTAGPTAPAGSSSPGAATSAGPATSAPPVAPTAVPPAAEGELPPGWDEPDGALPDDQLSQDEVDALLRVTATGPDGAGACAAGEVEYALGGLDAAAGHRYATLLVTNVSGRTCTVSGYLGIGGRGQWGHTLLLEAQQRPVADEGDGAPAVTLAPGRAARAWLEWTGELAGAGQERLSAFAFQLAAGQPAALWAPGEEMHVDVGMLSTVRVGPLRPWG